MKYQTLYKIVLSDNRSYRWKRHAFFWLAVLLYHMLRIGIMFPPIKNMRSFLSLLEMALYWGVVINMIVSYSVVYFLVPIYLKKKKYVLFTIGVLFLYILVVLLNFAHLYLILDGPVFHAIGMNAEKILTAMIPGSIRSLGNPPLICGLLLSLKILKNWHLEQLKTETLAKENASAELQLLKAQVHPHFLFNTLNNIYSFALNGSPQASTLVKKLSNMLQYMVNDCEQPQVPLEKEIKLIQDYIGLEKVRYGKRLIMEVEIEGSYANHFVAPLLLIPFVENCFKHGASVMRGEQWIKLDIHMKENEFIFQLSNSKPLEADSTNMKKGIGLQNVQKRLELLYPGNYFLNIETTTDVYTVQLRIQLHPVSTGDASYAIIPKLQPVVA